MQLPHQMLVTLILPMCDSGIWRQFEMMMSFRNPSPGNVNLNKNFTITAEQQVHFEWTLRSTRNYGTHESLWCNCFTKCWWLWKLAPIRSYDAISMTAAKTFPRKLKNLSTTWPSCQVNITSHHLWLPTATPQHQEHPSCMLLQLLGALCFSLHSSKPCFSNPFSCTSYVDSKMC